jgi:curved DNA-binding protein CbpA
MELKDYYSTLELPPSASADDVKRAYRRLAQVYHPDKTGNDPYARARFGAIKEAYEILSNPQQKEQYLQERWYAQSQGRTETLAPLTPESFLQRLLQRERHIYQIDVYRSDFASIVDQLQDFYSDEVIAMIHSFGDDAAKKEIMQISLRLARLIPHPHVQTLLTRLMKLDEGKNWQQSLQRIARQSRQDANWQKWSPWLAALAAILLCLMIFLLA